MITFISDNKVHLGTSFIFSYVSNYSNRRLTPAIMIASRDTAEVTITIPKLELQEKLTVDKYAELNFTNDFISGLKGIDRRIDNLGVEVVSDTPIALYTTNTISKSADGSVIIPEDMLGTHYIVNTHFSEESGYEEFVITATTDNTLVHLIMPGGETDTATLNRFDVLTRRRSYMSGTIITSSSPINVQAGHKCGNVPTDNDNHCDHLSTEILPIKYLQKTYIVPYMYPRGNFSVDIAAPYDQTSVSIYDTEGNLLESDIFSKGTSKIYLYENVAAISISASKPVHVSQFGFGAWNKSGDPSQTTIPPPQLYTNYYPFMVSEVYDTTNYVGIIIYRLYDVEAILLDGQRVSPVESLVINLPCTGEFNILYVEVSNGYHTLTHENPGVKFGAILYSRARRYEYVTYLGFEVNDGDTVEVPDEPEVY